MTYVYLGNDYVSNKTNYNSNEGILQKKPAGSDFHVHARTIRICLYFLTFQSDFIDFYVNKKKMLKKIIFFQFSLF